ncbi:hypothetical protein EON66_06390, partial [archaeon]
MLVRADLNYQLFRNLLQSMRNFLVRVDADNASTFGKRLTLRQMTQADLVWEGSAGTEMLRSCGLHFGTFSTYMASYMAMEEAKAAAQSENRVAKSDKPEMPGSVLKMIERLMYVAGYMFMQRPVDASAAPLPAAPRHTYEDDFFMIVKSPTTFTSRFGAPVAADAKKLCLWCASPAVVFREVESMAHSVILTSGTLSPMESFAGELGTPFPVRLTAPHVIDVKKQVWAGVVDFAPVAQRLVLTADGEASGDAAQPTVAPGATAAASLTAPPPAGGTPVTRTWSGSSGSSGSNSHSAAALARVASGGAASSLAAPTSLPSQTASPSAPPPVSMSAVLPWQVRIPLMIGEAVQKAEEMTDATIGRVSLCGVYASAQSPFYFDALAASILTIASATPGGMLVFLPSYALLERFVTHLRGCMLPNALPPSTAARVPAAARSAWNLLSNMKVPFVESREATADFAGMLKQCSFHVPCNWWAP